MNILSNYNFRKMAYINKDKKELLVKDMLAILYDGLFIHGIYLRCIERGIKGHTGVNI